MENIIKEKGAEAKMFIDKSLVDTETMKQIRYMITHPSVEHVRIMPDCHKGTGCCVGFTSHLNGKIVPNFIGGDIGCGIITYPINKKKINVKTLDNFIKQMIPISSGSTHLEPIVSEQELEDLYLKCYEDANMFVKKFKEKWDIHLEKYVPNYNQEWFLELCKKTKCEPSMEMRHLGTLGGGNHYIEINENEDTDEKYITIHSGSRSLGTHICRYHQNKVSGQEEGSIDKWSDIEKAVKQFKKTNHNKKEVKAYEQKIIEEFHANQKEKKVVEKKQCLEAPDTYEYYFDMIFAQNYAHVNRVLMLKIILEQMGLDYEKTKLIESVHNFIDFKDFVLRKGAIANYTDQYCIISLNMRDGILLCKGKTNEDWNYSTAHGAGRMVPRGIAKQKFRMKDFITSMEDVYSTSVNKDTIDESPMCYKDTELIKKLVVESVEIVAQLKPILNVKG
jgi:tRNA-splicing ligase RtcB (3'-phosphate/5'-hydroxy nucleic acid ligase)